MRDDNATTQIVLEDLLGEKGRRCALLLLLLHRNKHLTTSILVN